MKEGFIDRWYWLSCALALVLLFNSCGSSPSEKPSSKLVKEQVDQDSLVVEEKKETPPFKFPIPSSEPLEHSKQTVQLSDTSFDLTLPKNWKISVAMEGLKRPRFFTKSPDGRLFLTDMKNRSDNSKGKVLIFDGFDQTSGKLPEPMVYLKNLRNPNNLVFHTDTNGVDWLYLALTQKLIRYRYTPGETVPSTAEEIIAEFPDYGLSYKYGGWHLTRTVAIHNEKVYVSVGSSCNACEEKEPERASIIEMELDGGNPNHFAYGVRNAVDINWIHDELFSTNMGSDHLGDHAPDEALYKLERGAHYGWPYYYQEDGKILADTSQKWEHDSVKLESIPLAYAELGGHSAPLGFEYFEGDSWPESVRNYFVVALHGSGHVRIGNGYSVVRVSEGSEPEPVIYGWLQNGHRFGRPTDVFIYDNNSFFITDDHNGVVYYVETKLL